MYKRKALHYSKHTLTKKLCRLCPHENVVDKGPMSFYSFNYYYFTSTLLRKF